MSGALQKLLIKGYSDYKYSDEAGRIELMINPSKMSRNASIRYKHPETYGPLGSKSDEFYRLGPENLSFETLLDDTGAIADKSGKTLDQKISLMRDTLFKVNSKTHQPSFSKLIWGSFEFRGRLEKMDIDYTMFKPDGTPLRAKINFAFLGYINTQQEANEQGLNSPDLTHRVTVKPGDNLPLMCAQIYEDSSYYIKVAAFNGLTDFRNISPGTELFFPPLK
ncbi:peptidoglycan-binding protein [Fulvitalea axinellae]|uniref:Peptidoglycan-binding protein n=1 Tax=Fulvitalea axinellae TaxID=1182444 RepID=A0AAU9CN02_9BACT|nr:peptidoglycan-binding protein [Fulvitalea axinellae]